MCRYYLMYYIKYIYRIGATPKEVSFPAYAALASHYFLGAFYPTVYY